MRTLQVQQRSVRAGVCPLPGRRCHAGRAEKAHRAPDVLLPLVRRTLTGLSRTQAKERSVSLRDKTILFFAGPLYEDLELWYPKIRLEEEGVRTVVAGTGEKTYQGKRGYPITVDTSVDQISAQEFDGLVIPGGYAPDIMRRSQKLLQLTREIYQAGKPVAFICHAGWVPISAGIVKGKRGTSVGAIKDDLVNAGMVWEDSAVVVDGNLISSRTPADLPQFCKALIAALENQSPVASRQPSGLAGAPA